MQFKAYPKSKDIPNRKNRKSSRRDIFQHNRKAAKLARKAKMETRREAESEE